MEFKQDRPLYVLEEIAQILRGENGCAWDKKQTMATLKPYVIEEGHELCDAIDSGDAAHIREELGDLLFQIYSIAQIADEQGLFTIDDVAREMAEKLVRRHPHVFGGDRIDDPQKIIERWEQIKKIEKKDRMSILEGIPRNLPSLLKAYRIQQKVSRLGFDWETVDHIFDKLDEEIGELRSEIVADDREKITDEGGDVLFTVANILRRLEVNPDEALARTNTKFMERFAYIERKARERGIELADMSLGEMDDLWNEAKTAAVSGKDSSTNP